MLPEVAVFVVVVLVFAAAAVVVVVYIWAPSLPFFPKATHYPSFSYSPFSASLAHGDKCLDAAMSPIPPECFGSALQCEEEKLKMYEEVGLKAIVKGQVGVILLAGGQGTRLGELVRWET